VNEYIYDVGLAGTTKKYMLIHGMNSKEMLLPGLPAGLTWYLSLLQRHKQQMWRSPGQALQKNDWNCLWRFCLFKGIL